MQKYKVVASKSQKKYTLVLSADSEQWVKERLHKDGYSILTISELWDHEIQGKKFLFQVEKDGEIKNGVIIGKDIFKVYIKLVDELGYNIISLYPEWDTAAESAEKRAEILEKLKTWYDLQKKSGKQVKEKQKKEESFYLKKQIDETSKLIDKAASKMEYMVTNRQNFEIEDDAFHKLQKVYEKLLHIKGSTNIAKLQEIGELALIKLGSIELASLEKKKDETSRKLLAETNGLLKKIGSDKHFIESDRDYKKHILNFFSNFWKKFSLEEIKKTKQEKKKRKKQIDKESYSFLKTLLLLEKYKEKLSDNSKEIQKNIILFINPFSHSEVKDKILLKRKVIKQNISLLKAKKTGGLSSYTGIKKGFQKINDSISWFGEYIANNIFLFFIFYVASFFLVVLAVHFGLMIWSVAWYGMSFLLLLYIAYLLSHLSSWLVSLGINVVFFIGIYIFSIINF